MKDYWIIINKKISTLVKSGADIEIIYDYHNLIFIDKLEEKDIKIFQRKIHGDKLIKIAWEWLKEYKP